MTQKSDTQIHGGKIKDPNMAIHDLRHLIFNKDIKNITVSMSEKVIRNNATKNTVNRVIDVSQSSNQRVCCEIVSLGKY